MKKFDIYARKNRENQETGSWYSVSLTQFAFKALSVGYGNAGIYIHLLSPPLQESWYIHDKGLRYVNTSENY